MRRVLLLGGTSEARALGPILAAMDGVAATVSLAGRTVHPAEQALPSRRGGFGGIDGLCVYLRDNRIDLVVDATHPFAVQMSRHAVAAHVATGVALLHIDRPAWVPEPPEDWIRVPDLVAAVAALPSGARAFTATGRGSLDTFAARRDIYTILRVIDPPGGRFPGNGCFEVARPPFSVAAEIDRLRDFEATHLVVKNAGGGPARTKLTAAAKLGVPIVIVDRTPLPRNAPRVETVDQARDWLLKWAADPA